MSQKKVNLYVYCIRNRENGRVIDYKCYTDYKTTCKGIRTKLVQICCANDDIYEDELDDIGRLVATWIGAPIPDFRSEKTTHFIISVQKVPVTLL